MRVILCLSLSYVSLFASPAFASYNETVCKNVAKQSAEVQILADHPGLAHSDPKISIETPDDLDKLPDNATKIYLSYGCKTEHPVSYLVVVTSDASSDKCSVYYVWDVGASNARAMCEWPK
jgi:hypothetical protein